MAKNHPFFIEIGQGLSLMIGLPTINSWETNKRPLNPKQGTFGFNSQTKSLEYFNGKDWYKCEMGEA